jgi:hypothetical protein
MFLPDIHSVPYKAEYLLYRLLVLLLSVCSRAHVNIHPDAYRRIIYSVTPLFVISAYQTSPRSRH